MTAIPHNVKQFLEKEHYVIVASLNKNKNIHTSAKGVLEVDPKGKIYILDLYKAWTYRNVKRNSSVTLTLVDDHKFKGYSIEGRAKIIKEDILSKKTMKVWHDKLAKRIARRIVRHIKEETGEHKAIPEAKFPLPKYLIEVSVDRIVDLAPQKLK